jgi:shikimate kinase
MTSDWGSKSRPSLFPEPGTTRESVVFLVGASGSGKTVIGKRASESTGWGLYDTDAQILSRTGTERISDIFDTRGESYFRQLESECLSEIIDTGTSLIVATGGGLPGIPGMMEKLNGVGFSVYLKANAATLWKRLNTDPRQLEDRPLLRGAGPDELKRLIGKRESAYIEASLTLDTDQLSVDQVCALLITQIESIRQGSYDGER